MDTGDYLKHQITPFKPFIGNLRSPTEKPISAMQWAPKVFRKREPNANDLPRIRENEEKEGLYQTPACKESLSSYFARQKQSARNFKREAEESKQHFSVQHGGGQ